jgi:hypothetical protein
MPLSREPFFFKNGDLAQRVRALAFSARRCCRRSRVRAPVWPGTFLRRNINMIKRMKDEDMLLSYMRGFQPLLHGRLLELLGASTQLAICSKSPCSIAINTSWPYLQDAISSSPPLQLSRKVVRTRSEHSSHSAHTFHYVRTNPGTIAERNLISAKLARLCGDSRSHWVQTEKAEIPSCRDSIHVNEPLLTLKIWLPEFVWNWQGDQNRLLVCLWDFEV